MIITYPIHLPYVAGSEHRVVPDTLYNNSEILSGSYPMGKNRFWHGGVHLHPTDRNAPIRAIADGEIVAYRFDDVDAQDEYFDKTSYSRSFVLLKHETELGQTSLGNSRLVFYSLYMHLRAWSKVKDKTGEQAINFLKKTVPPQPKIRNGHPLKDTQGKPIMEREREERLVPTADGTVRPGAGHSRVQRGDVLGYCGHIPDNLTTPSQGIHFEIFLEDVNFLENPVQAIWGKCFLTASLPVLNELLSKKELAVEQNKPLTVVNGKIDRGYLRIKVDEENKLWIAQDQFHEENNSVPHPRQRGKTQVQKQFIPVDKRVAACSSTRSRKIFPAKPAPCYRPNSCFGNTLPAYWNLAPRPKMNM